MRLVKWTPTNIDSATKASGTEFFAVLSSAPPARLSEPVGLRFDPNFKYSWDDLAQLGDTLGFWDPEDGIEPTAASIEQARALLVRVQTIATAPEISSLENGTILLLWKFDRGYFSIELGSSTFGLIAMRPGFPTLRINGDIEDLLASLRPAPIRNAPRLSRNDLNLWSGLSYKQTESLYGNSNSRIRFSIADQLGARIATP
jgi:hypothetical protein